MGALLAGTFADNYSRRFSIFISCGAYLFLTAETYNLDGKSVIFSIGSLFQCGAQSLLHIFIGRAVGGVGVGALRYESCYYTSTIISDLLSSMLSPLYMAEISPPEVRGSLMALEQFAIVLGVVLGFWLGYFTRDSMGLLYTIIAFPAHTILVLSSASWRIPLGVQIIPAVVLIMACAFLPASPRLLVLQGKYDEAVASLAQLRLRSREEAQNDPLIQVCHLSLLKIGPVFISNFWQIEFLEMRVEATMIQRTFGTAETSKYALSNEWSSWKRLLGKKYRDRTMIGVLMAFFQRMVHFLIVKYVKTFLCT